VSDEPWAEVARTLRMSLSHVSDAHVTGTTFQTLRREMIQGAAWPGTAGTTPWLYGQRRDASVIVRPLTLRLTTAKARPPAPTHVTAIAEIDPPLFAGLRMFTNDLVPYFGWAKGNEPTSHPALDTKFLSYAFDLDRVREIFVPRGVPDRLGEAVGHSSGSCGIVIKDSQVETIATAADEPNVAHVDELVDIATSIAREVSNRAQKLRQTPLEIEARGAWQRLAAKLGLSIDPLRWHIYGPLDGVEVSAMLEGSPPGVSTTFRARFRTRLPSALFLRRGFRVRQAFVTSADGNPPGFPELDGILVLQSRDPEQARAMLRDPELRRMLAAEAQTSNLVLDECEIMLGRGGFADTREIATRLQSLVAIVDRITPALRTNAGPFR
jgi:hypothetical protein